MRQPDLGIVELQYQWFDSSCQRLIFVGADQQLGFEQPAPAIAGSSHGRPQKLLLPPHPAGVPSLRVSKAARDLSASRPLRLPPPRTKHTAPFGCKIDGGELKT